MAAAEVRPKMTLWRGDTCIRLAKLIRFPTDGGKISFWCYRKFNDPVLLLAKDPSSDLIRSKIIPAISNLRQVYPLKLTIFFPTAFQKKISYSRNIFRILMT